MAVVNNKFVSVLSGGIILESPFGALNRELHRETSVANEAHLRADSYIGPPQPEMC